MVNGLCFELAADEPLLRVKRFFDSFKSKLNGLSVPACKMIKVNNNNDMKVKNKC